MRSSPRSAWSSGLTYAETMHAPAQATSQVARKDSRPVTMPLTDGCHQFLRTTLTRRQKAIPGAGGSGQ